MAGFIWYEVRGIGEFPIDMLRYDGSYPATERDAGRIEETFEEGATMSDEPIKLKAHYEGPFGAIAKPTASRWRSFAWQVVSVETGP